MTDTRIPGWVAPYIGIPFVAHGRDRAGADCWGILRLALAEQFGVTLPSYTERYGSVTERAELAALIRGELGPWREIPVSAVRAGDGLLLRLLAPCHVALVVAPGWMLHVEQGKGTCLEDYRRPQWARRVVGAYRHEALA